MADTVYISNGPTLNGAVKVSGNGPGQANSSQTTSLSGPGASGQSQLEDVTVGSMPVVNTLTVETNKDGTIGIKTTVADAMPETGPGASSRNSSTSASTGSVSSVGVQTGWVQVGNGYKYYKEDGSGYKTGWHYEYNADGSKIWYYFDEKPDTKEWMATGWRRIVNGAGVLCWYHFRVDGKMSRYWECLDGWWYYFEPRDDAGYLVSDWYILNNEYYYFNTDDDKGYMQIDWLKIRGKWYYFHKTDEKRGMMAHDFLMRHTDGNLYYLQEKSDGSMAVNKTIKDPATGIVYDADEDGVCREVIGSGRDVFIPEVVTGKINGKAITLNPRENNWGYAGKGKYPEGVQKDSYGRYKIAIGPKIVNPNYPDQGKIWTDYDGLKKGILIDVVLEKKNGGEKKIIECVVVDFKAHTYNKYPDGHEKNNLGSGYMNIENGILQTGISYPKSWNAGQSLALAPNNVSGNVIEFAGHKVDFIVSEYRLVKLIVKD